MYPFLFKTNPGQDIGAKEIFKKLATNKKKSRTTRRNNNF